MRLLTYTAPTIAEDLGLEEALHQGLEDGTSEPTWRIWQPEHIAAILGTGQAAALEVDLEQAAARNISVYRRHSGGGTVVIGGGAINYSAFFRIADVPGSETIRGAMSAALGPLLALMKTWGIAAHEAGLSDLAVMASDGHLRKIAGNSQARKKRSVVVHGTLLANPDWDTLGSVLRFPSKVPDYRCGREHRSFLTSLQELKAPYDKTSFTEGLMQVLPSVKLRAAMPAPDELSRAAELAREKYGTREWTFRR